MKTPRLSELVGIINKLSPPHLAESWDNVGLQLGDPTAEISRIMVALDPTASVVRAAIDASCQLLLTHHPLIFKPLKNITTSTSTGRIIHEAICNHLAVMSIHTNFDIVDGGLNDLLANRLELRDCRPLRVTARREPVKLVCFVPATHLEQLRRALFPFALRQGNYGDCSFSAAGEGTFTPLDGATPHIGTPNTLERVPEQRLEFLLERSDLARAIKALCSAHPYEEPAFDIYPLLNDAPVMGLGRIGRLPEACRLEDFAARLAGELAVTGLRYVGSADRQVSKVALCTGSGASLLHDAVRAGADLLLTGDVKYHEAREAEELGIALIDAGHFATEIIMAAAVAERLDQTLRAAGYPDCRVVTAPVEHDPFTICTNSTPT